MGNVLIEHSQGFIGGAAGGGPEEGADELKSGEEGRFARAKEGEKEGPRGRHGWRLCSR